MTGTGCPFRGTWRRRCTPRYRMAAERGAMSERQEVSTSPVFVLSSGRSGSTLVQRLLNCHRGIVLWGEHFGFLASPLAALAQMHGPAQRQFPRTAGGNRGWSRLLPDYRNPAEPIEWVNPYSAQEYAERLRGLVEGYFAARLPATRRWGFKEIRYNTAPVLRGLWLLYPEARFVFVTRDAVEVTRSKVYAFLKESRWAELSPDQQRRRVQGMLRELAAHYRVFDDFAAEQPAAAERVAYEDLLADPGATIARMLAHLRLEPRGFDKALADRVLGEVITTTPRDDHHLLGIIREAQAALREGTGAATVEPRP